MTVKKHCCEFCHKPFTRPDVVRRHYERCPSRNARAIPQKKQPGRRKHACDQCAQSKLACDADLPCETCLFQGRECTRAQSSSTLATLQSVEHPETRFPIPKVRISPQLYTTDPGHAPMVVFEFLLKYTAPARWSLPDTIGEGHITSSENGYSFLFRDETMVGPDQYELNITNNRHQHDETIDDQLFNYIFAEEVSVSQQIASPSSNDGLSVAKPIPFAPEVIMAHGIIDELICFVTVFKGFDGSESLCKATMPFYQLLLSGNLRGYVANYFNRWHRHSPIIHRPTFRITNTSSPLILALVIIGALLSVEVETKLLVEQVLDIAEDYIFEHEHFRSLLLDGQQRASARQQLSIIQAAHCLTQVQMRSQSAAKRMSVRQDRFQQLIIASQSFNHRYKHVGIKTTNATLTADSEILRDFGVIEAAKRVSYGIFNLEASFTILHDTTPRLLLQDLDLSLSCSVDEFSTGRPRIGMCDSELRASNTQLRDILEILLEGQEKHSEVCFYHLDVLHLFVVILAILQKMWMSANIPESISMTRFDFALRRWRRLWDLITSSTTHTLFEDMHGFYRTAALEFWHLGMLLLRRGRFRLSEIGGLEALS